MELQTVVRDTEGAKHHVGIAGIESETPVMVRTMAIWKMIGVRVLRVYIQTFLGLLGADGLGVIDLAPVGESWAHITSVGLVSLAPAFVSLLQNALEFLTKLDVTSPSMRA